MNKDEYNQVINGEETYKSIADELIKYGRCIIGWTDEQCDHRDILFTYRPHKYGELQRGLRWTYLYVSIMSLSCMGFLIEADNNNEKHPNYIKEKLNLKNNHCDDAICELINGVIRAIDDIHKINPYEEENYE
jgi:hypothetical protein